MRAKPLLIAGAALAITLPALAQQAPPPAGAPTAAPTQPSNTVQPTPGPSPQPSRGPLAIGPGEDQLTVEEVSLEDLPPPPPPVELPAHARRDPTAVGRLDPVQIGLGASPWGGASGGFLSTLMRRMDTPLASRWAHIALRNTLLARVPAPGMVNSVDWVAERAWLLLRMGEADAARMLVAGVDVDRFTPKMFQVAVQSALANGDPPGLCPLEAGIRRHDPQVRELVSAMCASLSGEPESAAAQIDHARRFGRIGGIDLVLAEKVVGAGANTGRSVVVEWEPVDRLTSWRFGLATATGMVPPQRLVERASPRLRAFQARAALLTPEQRLPSALVAAGLGVFSSQSLTDLYSGIYDRTDPSDLPSTDAWQVRQAFLARDRAGRLAAIRRVLAIGKDGFQKEAARAVAARAASLIEPDATLQDDSAELISAMLAGGYDREAARWIGAVRRMDDRFADRAWAMLALAGADRRLLDISFGRISGFINRDQSEGKSRSALLVAGLFGLGRIDARTADNLNRRYRLGIGRTSSWTRMIDAAAGRGQAGTVLVLTGTGLQTQTFADVPPAHLYHSVLALKRTGQDYTARMVAAEALSRT